jgi:hypothetical protein
MKDCVAEDILALALSKVACVTTTTSLRINIRITLGATKGVEFVNATKVRVSWN